MAEDKSFKVGDTVLYEGWKGKAITEVTKITPKGGVRVRFDEDALFKDGEWRSSAGHDWGRVYSASIRKITPEEEATLKQEWGKKRVIKECRKALEEAANDHNLTYETAEKLLEILNSPKEPKGE